MEEFLTVKTVGNSNQYGTLPDTIKHREDGRHLTIPPDIGKLLSVYEDEETQEDGTAWSIFLALLLILSIYVVASFGTL